MRAVARAMRPRAQPMTDAQQLRKRVRIAPCGHAPSSCQGFGPGIHELARGDWALDDNGSTREDENRGSRGFAAVAAPTTRGCQAQGPARRCEGVNWALATARRGKMHREHRLYSQP